MEIKIKVKANSKEEKIEKRDGYYFICVKERAVENWANKAVLKLLKKHFGKQARILRGFKSREKVIELG